MAGVASGGRSEDLRGGALLDHPAVPHHDHLVGERAHHAQVVADEQVGEAVPRLQLAQQVDDLRLHRHVERGGRLVEHDEARPQHHGAGDGDALALAARELVRIAVAQRRGRGRPRRAPRRSARRARPARADAVDAEALLDDLRRPRAAGDRLPNGSWKTICISRRSGRSARARRPGSSCPSNAMRALARASRRSSARPSVVLPEPLSPDHAHRLRPRARVRLTPSTALTWPTVRRSTPALDREPHADVARRHHHRRRRRAARRGRAVRLGREQPPRVGVLRAAEAPSATAPGLDDLAALITQTRSADRAHDAEVVGDEQHRHAEARLQLRAGASRICAWMVTSSAVVGSSAISRSGSLASAMAIITRWRWPPESWCG